MEIKAIGIGGIGCALLPFLCRFLQYAGEGARLTLMDGDSFERSNAARQAFPRLDRGGGPESDPAAPAHRVRDLRGVRSGQ